MDKILKLHFDNFMRHDSLPPELCELQGVKLFADTELLDVWRNNFKGIQWTDEQGNILRGAVDNILQNKKDGKLIVLDYKTRGYPLKEDTADHYQDQMNIYNFLLRKNGYETEDYAYLLFYHPQNVNKEGDIVFNKDLIKMPISVDNAEKIFKNALEILNNQMPTPDEECEYCGWADILCGEKNQKNLNEF